MFGPFIPVEKNNAPRLERMNQCVKYAIERYNEQEGVAPLKFDEVVHATYRITGGTTYFITFKASVASGEQKVYQAIRCTVNSLGSVQLKWMYTNSGRSLKMENQSRNMTTIVALAFVLGLCSVRIESFRLHGTASICNSTNHHASR
ncbi:hypothetical protein Tsubulata_030074 [Turnera subulata]|uniref:Cystatin domain-containing protein n=1 Tax=Turnera subulata TaxID=218843 RepID=A0A9Q0JB56_9ROSI|nr:hypothetical protein Tsubulata_030074 [Turnera subulata]